MIEADHREVEKLFEKFAAANEDSVRRDLAIAICVALKVHARLEELFYRAASKALDDKNLIEEAWVEHASAMDLIAQIETGVPGETFFETVKVLAEYSPSRHRRRYLPAVPRKRDGTWTCVARSWFCVSKS